MKIRESKLSSVMIFFEILENLLKISMDLIDIDLDVDPDPLVEHIRDSGLPLKMRPPTLSDGNCWYDAVADQIRLMKIPDKPTYHAEVRDNVTKSLMNLPQTQTWIQNFFNNSMQNFQKFIADHQKTGTWTDNRGILCQATAFYLREF